MKVADGMDLISDDPEITEVRKASLELLMSDHAGDCEAPCSLSCPANMNIPLMNRLIAAGNYAESLKVVKKMIALPFILGYICPAPCEKACRRKQIDNPVSICLLKRFTAKSGLDSGQQRVFSREKINQLPDGSIPGKSKKIAIIGSGPAGLSAAFYLQQKACSCVIFEKNEKAGGTLRYSIPEEKLPGQAIDAEIEIITRLGAEFRYKTQVTAEYFRREIQPVFDAVILASGDISMFPELTSLFQVNPSGIKVDEHSHMTSLPGVFACGSVIRPQNMAVRTAMQGRETADAVDYYLRKVQFRETKQPFNSRFDKLMPEEFEEYLKESVRENRIQPEAGWSAGFSEAEAMAEARRCLHCDCRKMDNCKLRNYSGEYQVDRKRYALSDRKKMKKYFQQSNVVYEPEKCIRCGLCVDITSVKEELTGLTFIGRGFDVQIDIPFGRSLAEALTLTAGECVESCPTGALSFKENG